MSGNAKVTDKHIQKLALELHAMPEIFWEFLYLLQMHHAWLIVG